MNPSELDRVFDFNKSDCDESDISNYYSNETLVHVIYSSIVKSLDSCIFSLKRFESSDSALLEIRRALSLISGLKNALVGSSKTAEQMHHSYSVIESKLQQSFSTSDIELLCQIRSTIHEIAESWDLEGRVFNSSASHPKVVH